MSYIGNVKVGSTTHLVGSTLYGTCNTAAGTAEKAVTCANFDELLTGVTIHVKFDNTNTIANPTLNVNNTGAKAIKRYGTTAPSTSVQTSWYAGAVISFTYDGTHWMMDDWTYTADGNDTSSLRTYYSNPITGGNGIKQYSLFARLADGTYSSFTTNNGTGTKTFDTTNYFDIRKIFYYNGSGNVASGSYLADNTMSLQENLVDARYTFNNITTSSGFTANKPVYLVFNRSTTKNNFYQLKSPYWTHTPESYSLDSVFVLVGYAHDTYRVTLLINNNKFIACNDSSQEGEELVYPLNDYVNVGQKGSTPIGQSATAEGYDVVASGYCSHSEGYKTVSDGSYSHAEGQETSALSSFSHAEGYGTSSSGKASHAEGYITTANGGDGSHAEGYYTLANGLRTHAEGYATTSNGNASHAEGNATCSSSSASHAEGDNSKAVGKSAHAEGDYTTASGSGGAHAEGSYTFSNYTGSHAEGVGSTAVGNGSHSEGIDTFSANSASHAEGDMSCAVSHASHAEGKSFSAGEYSHGEGHSTYAFGHYSHAEGYCTTASGSSAHTEGESTFAIKSSSHAEGYHTITNGFYSHSEGYYTTAHGERSHVEGSQTYAQGSNCHAEGEKTTAYANYSHAEGERTISDGEASHSEGYYTSSSQLGSHAEGQNTTACGYPSHAEGVFTVASGNGSHSEGVNTTASNYGSHTEGYYTIASSTIQHVAGKFNVADNNDTYARIIGGGSSETDRKNILTTDWYGNIQCGFNSPYKAIGGTINGLKIFGKHGETSVKSVRLFWPVSNDFSFCGFILLRKAVYFLSVSTSSSDGSVTYKWCQKVAGDTTPITGTSVVTSGKITDSILGSCAYIEMPLATDKWTQVQFILTSYNGLTHPSSRVDGYLNKLHMSYVDDSSSSTKTICDYDDNQNNIY